MDVFSLFWNTYLLFVFFFCSLIYLDTERRSGNAGMHDSDIQLPHFIIRELRIGTLRYSSKYTLAFCAFHDACAGVCLCVNSSTGGRVEVYVSLNRIFSVFVLI